jgi:hypothetical protein
VVGKYVGRMQVRPGREDELSSAEKKQLQKGQMGLDLVLREDGTFLKQITEGTWKLAGDRVVLQPTHFGGKTLEQMRETAEEMGRTFGLAFVFNPFELIVGTDCLETPEDGGVMYTVFERA